MPCALAALASQAAVTTHTMMFFTFGSLGLNRGSLLHLNRARTFWAFGAALVLLSVHCEVIAGTTLCVNGQFSAFRSASNRESVVH